MRTVLFALALTAILSSRAVAANPSIRLTVSVSLTEEGKKRTPPSKDHPVYYYPIVPGYAELGEIVAGEKMPPRKETIRLLAKALAEQGYLVTQSMEQTPPSLLLVFRWGYMNPDKALISEERTVFFNKSHLLALVSGRTIDEVDNLERQGFHKTIEQQATVVEGAEPRYFVIVSAYGLSDLSDHKTKAIQDYRKKNLLWQARVSVASGSISSMEHVFPTLITSMAPHFGREAMPPARFTAKVQHRGVVEVGTPTVMPEASPSPAPR